MSQPFRIANPLRQELEDLMAAPPRHRRWWLIVGAAAVVALLSGVLAGSLCARAGTSVPDDGIEAACFGPRRVCLTNHPSLPWLSYVKQHHDLLGEVRWHGAFEGRPGCTGFDRTIVCPSSDPRVRGTIRQFERIDLGLRLFPKGLVLQADAPVHPLVAGYIEQLKQQRRDPAYWLGQPLAPAICTATAGAGQGSGECEQWYEFAAVRFPTSTTATVADVYLSDLGRQTQP